jgi:methionyl-tRNA synthetase
VHEAFASAMDLARAANVYVEERQPWAQAKDPARAAELDETLSTLAQVLVVLCALFQPVAPEKMEILADRLGLDSVPTLDEAVATEMAGRTVTPGSPLFPRVDPGWASEKD